MTAKVHPHPDCDSRSEPGPGGVGRGESNKVVKVCWTAMVKDIVH